MDKKIQREEVVKEINSWTKAMNYQSIPFRNYEGIRPHREDHKHVFNSCVNAIKKENYDIKGKSVLDVGSNIGYFAFSFRKEGAGDLFLLEKIGKIAETARKIAEIEELENVEVSKSTINNLEQAEKIKKCDIVVYKSVHHWVRKFSDNEMAKKIFGELTKQASIVLYEPGNFGNAKVSEEDDNLPEIFGFKTVTISKKFRGRKVKVCFK